MALPPFFTSRRGAVAPPLIRIPTAPATAMAPNRLVAAMAFTVTLVPPSQNKDSPLVCDGKNAGIRKMCFFFLMNLRDFTCIIKRKQL
jgi:hypothetical protein